MREDMKRALLRSYDLRIHAEEMQLERGTIDVGTRSQVTAGKHLDEVVGMMAGELIGFAAGNGSVFYGKNGVDIPGWFRASKQWDILAFKGDQLIAGIELKSVSSSYGNNLNNRLEEAIGEAVDAKFANDRGLINHVIPPLMCYALIVKKEKESESIRKNPSSSHFPVDPVFEGTSYLDRFRIMCERLRREGIYGAVWFVIVDPENGAVEEPVPELSYEAFLHELKAKVESFASYEARLRGPLQAFSLAMRISWWCLHHPSVLHWGFLVSSKMASNLRYLIVLKRSLYTLFNTSCP